MGGMLPGGGGQSGGGGGGSSPMNPVGMEFGGPPNADVSGGASPDLYNTNAMNTGDQPATDSPATNLYAYSPAATSAQEAQATGAPPETTAPGGQPSGGAGGVGGFLGNILSALVGPAHAGTVPRAGGPAEGDTSYGRGGSYGWTQQAPANARDAYGNTYTSQPGYQGLPTSPLPPTAQPQQPPQAPSRTPAPATPAPAPSPSPSPRRQGGENVPLPRARPAEADATPPLNQEGAEIPAAVPPPEEVEKEATQPPQPPFNDRTVVRGDLRYAPSPVEVAAPTARGATPGQPPARAAPAPAPAPAAVPPYISALTPGRLMGTRPADPAFGGPPATVSPQSGTAPGGNIQAGAAAAQSPLAKLLQGDLTGAVSSFIDQLRAQNPNIVTPNELNRTLKGDQMGRPAPANPLARSIQARQGMQDPFGQGIATAGPTALSTARASMAPGATQGPGTADIRAGNLIAGVPPQTASTARAYRYQTGEPRGTTGWTPTGAPVSRETVPAGAAGAQPLSLGQPNQTPQQTEQIYQAWLRSTGMPDNPNSRTRFNIENGTFRNLRNQANQGYPRGDPRIWTNERGQLLNAPGQTGRYPTPGTGSLTPAERELYRQQGQIPDPRSPQQEVPPGTAGAGGVRNQATQPYIPGGMNAPRGPRPAPPPDVPGFTPGSSNQPRNVPPGAAGAQTPFPPGSPSFTPRGDPGFRPSAPFPDLYNQATPEQQRQLQEMTPQERVNQVMGKRPGSAIRPGQAGATTQGMHQTRKADREILRDRFLMGRERNERAQQQRWQERKRGRDPGEPLDAPLDVIRRNRRIAPSNRYELSGAD